MGIFTSKYKGLYENQLNANATLTSQHNDLKNKTNKFRSTSKNT